jgi:hypothetical protein
MMGEASGNCKTFFSARSGKRRQASGAETGNFAPDNKLKAGQRRSNARPALQLLSFG